MSNTLRRGTRVTILDREILSLAHRKNRNGRVVRINGGYIYVRPMWWPRKRPALELYSNEIKILP